MLAPLVSTLVFGCTWNVRGIYVPAMTVTRPCGKLLCALAPLLFAAFSLAQDQDKDKSTPPPAPAAVEPSAPSGMDQPRGTVDSDGNPSSATKPDNCFLPPLNGLQMAMGVAELQVPAKVQREFDEGCAALRNKKLADAEGHLRKAVKQDARFSAAWVLLGQILEAQQDMEDAHDACSKPTGSYVPAYLCLADIASRSKSWDDVLRLSSLALEVDPTTAAPAYAYNAAANFNLHNLPAAQESALRAIDIDKANKNPRIHFLLAQIYGAQGDRADQAVQLREYLKYVTDPNDAEMVKKTLATLE
jgi:tetratricopeptide (TPR) repeat protein